MNNKILDFSGKTRNLNKSEKFIIRQCQDIVRYKRFFKKYSQSMIDNKILDLLNFVENKKLLKYINKYYKNQK